MTAAIVMCGLIFLWWRMEPIAYRLVELAERRIQQLDQKPEAPAPLPEPEPMPKDLFAVAMSYRDEWAREQALHKMNELKEETGSWEHVREAYPVEV